MNIPHYIESLVLETTDLIRLAKALIKAKTLEACSRVKVDGWYRDTADRLANRIQP